MPTQGGGTPAKKKRTTGPTKAAALKKLGLTQEDLNALKELRSQQGATPTADPSFEDKVAAVVAQQASKHAVYGSATVHPASDPQAHLEDRKAPEQVAWNSPDEDAAPVWYARNLRGVDVGFRFTRQQESGQKRTNLKPRGSRGDMVRLHPEDLRDPELATQVSYGLIEVIPEGEAQAAIKKQYTNAQTEVPNHISMLRNPLGEEYQQANPVKFATDEEAYGVKVADLNPDLMAGKLSDKEIFRDGGFVQNAGHTPTGGNPAIISDGFLAATQSEDRGNNEKQAEVDAKFRAGQFEDRPEDNLGVKVTLEPTQRTQ